MLRQIPLGFLFALLLTACAQGPIESPHTGDPLLEAGQTELASDQGQAGQILFVSSERVRVRQTPEVKPDNLVGTLELNDRVEVVSSERLTPEQFLNVKVVSTKGRIAVGTMVFISAKFLSVKEIKKATNPYFVIVNFATEKLRLYKQCAAPENCRNRMLLQAPIVGGEDDDGTKSNLGYYRITKWIKFYEDNASHYPAWYHPDYPPVPPPGAKKTDWLDKSVMPEGRGQARGAFGWYTAHVGPNASSQWMHGTYGWGSDKMDFITFTGKWWAGIVSVFANIRSHGCTRVDNETISYLRQIIPEGTPVLRIYAKETYRDEQRPLYSQEKTSWNYILTKVGYGSTKHQLADREMVLDAGTPESEWLEQGTYEVQAWPVATPFDPKKKRSKGGNLYKLKEAEFSGHFLVDEGTLGGYQHPPSLKVGGVNDPFMPSYVLTEPLPQN